MIKNRKHETLSYTAFVRPTFEYGAVCCDPYRATKRKSIIIRIIIINSKKLSGIERANFRL